MFSKPVDNELKKKVYSNLQNNPSKNVLALKKTVEEAARNSKLEELKDFMRIIKKMIKDKLPAPIAGQIDGVLSGKGPDLGAAAGALGGLFGR